MRGVALVLFLCAVAVGSVVAIDKTSFPMPRYNVDLDRDPLERWDVVADAYGPEIRKIFSWFASLIPEQYRQRVNTIINDTGEEINKKLGEYGSEIIGLADRVGIPHGDLVVINMMYELTAKCTSIVAQHPDGTIYHGRNLDFGEGGAFTNFLRSIAIEVHFQRNGTTVYTGTTYAGYVGLLTAERPHYFSYSIDEVVDGPLYAELLNVIDGVLNDDAELMGFLIRNVLENSTFTEAVQTMGYTDVVAPAYFIMGGVQEGEGVVITRGRNKPKDFWYLKDSPFDWPFLVETNYDHWLPPPANDNRRDPAIECMNEMGQANLTSDSLYACLSKEPNLNSLTTYTAIMHNSEGYYECKIRRCC